MIAEPTTFYVELLKARLRYLNGEIARTGRWDDSFSGLSEERDAVEHELAGLSDDRSAGAKATKQSGAGR